MLKNALNRCQATPQVRFRPTTASQIIPDSSLISAITETATVAEGSTAASGWVTKLVHSAGSSMPLEILNAFTPRMPRPSMTTTASTK